MADCAPDAIWAPDPADGQVQFLDAPGGTYTIPNYAVRFVGTGDTELGVAELTGDDLDVVNGVVAHPKVERTRRSRLQLQMTFWQNAAGTAWDDPNEGWHENWVALKALADDTVTDTNGLQTVRWIPYTGATPIDFEAHVLPPVQGDVTQGKGLELGLVIEIPDPSPLP